MSLYADAGKAQKALDGDISGYGNNRSDAVQGGLVRLMLLHDFNEEKVIKSFESSKLCEMWSDKWTRLKDSEIRTAREFAKTLTKTQPQMMTTLSAIRNPNI